MSKPRKSKSRNRNRKKAKSKSLPSLVELVMGAKSDMIVQASFRTGAGMHQDKRRKKGRKKDWIQDQAN